MNPPSRPDDLLVFLGPSLPAAEAQRVAPCRVLPPARQGDVWRALALRPRAIALVDGLFESTPSVWHHELLDALDAGVALFGGASMGALRAAELSPFGMVGVGRIFAGYRDGELTDDSEVALLHSGAEHGFKAFTVPLVNVRHNAARARQEGALTRSQERALVSAAERVFYQDRTWRRLLDEVAWPKVVRARWDAFAARGLQDLKALDARECLAAAAAWVASGVGAPVVPAIKRSRSSLVRRHRLADGASLGPGGSSLPSREVVEALWARPDSSALAEAGLRRLLLAEVARELGLRPTRARLEAARRRWLDGLGLGTSADPLARLGLDEGEAARIAETLALEELALECAPRMTSDGHGLDEGLALEARLSGLWARVARAPRRS